MLHHKAVVLIVEDSPVIRLCAVDLVESAGFEALQASSADEAIRILEARLDIHLVFTDVEMPGTMDGLKLSHYIRHRWPPVRLIVTSGKTIVSESHLPMGVRFFPKPYNDSVIVEAMISALSQVNSRPLSGADRHSG